MADKTLKFAREKWPELDIVAAASLEQHPRRLWASAIGLGAVIGVATSALGFELAGGGVAGAFASIFFQLGTSRFVLMRTATDSLLFAPTRGGDDPPRPPDRVGWLGKGVIWDRWDIDGDVFRSWQGHRRRIDALLSEMDHASVR